MACTATPGRSTSLVPGVIYQWTPEGSLVVDPILDLSPTTAARTDRRACGVEIVPGYWLTDRLGAGCTGEVWRAIGPGEVPVALKFVGAGERGATQEVRSLAWMSAVRHANLISIFSIWERADWTVIGMELADGSLLDRFEAARATGAVGMGQIELIDFLRQAARGIDFLNETRHTRPDQPPVALIHRDIKPANLLLVGGSIQIGDFGLVQPVPDGTSGGSTGDITAIESLVTAYSAPEVRRGEVSSQSDQYSLAATYCHLRGGRVPITLVAPATAPDLSMLPPAERPAVARALAADPAGRWPSCAAFVEALAAAVPINGSPLAGSKLSRRLLLAAPVLVATLMLPTGDWWSKAAPGPATDPAVIVAQPVIVADPAPQINVADPAPRINPRPLVETQFLSAIQPPAAPPAVETSQAPVVEPSVSITDQTNSDDRDDEPVIATEPGPSASEIMDALRVWSRTTAATVTERVAASIQSGRAWITAHQPRPTPQPQPRLQPQPIIPHSATVIVQMPSTSSELVVRGEVGRGTPDEWYGPRRVIHTAPISSGQEYVIGAFWTNASSQIHHRSGTLLVQPGRTYEIDLRTEQPTAIELNRPADPALLK